MMEGVVFSKVFGTELYEVAGIGGNQCSTLISDLLHDCFMLLLNHKAAALFLFLTRH